MKSAIVFPALRGYFSDFEMWDQTFIGDMEMIEILQLKAILEEYGYQTDKFELLDKEKSKENIKLLMGQYDVYLLYIEDFYSVISLSKLIKKIKRINTDCKAIVFGYYTILNYQNIIKLMDEIDAAVVSLDEKTVVDLLGAFQSGCNWQETMGIAYKNAQGKTILNPAPQKYQIHNLPWVNHTGDKNERIEMRTMTGCTGQCIYCEMASARRSIKFNDIRIRDAVDVVNEIEYLVKNKNTKFIKFQDESFLLYSTKRMKWLSEFITLIKQRDIKIKMLAQARVSDVIRCKDLLPSLNEIGMDQMFIGVESMLQSKLDFYHKGSTVEENIEAYTILDKMRYRIGVGFMLFDPYATVDEIKIIFTNLLKYEMYKHSFDAGSAYAFPVDSMVGVVYANKLYDMVTKDNLTDTGKWYGYRFKYEKTQKYYDCCFEWGSNCSQIDRKIFQINTSDSSSIVNSEEGRAYIDVCNAIKRINLEYLIKLADQVIKSENDINFNAFIEEWNCRKKEYYRLIDKWGVILE